MTEGFHVDRVKINDGKCPVVFKKNISCRTPAGRFPVEENGPKTCFDSKTTGLDWFRNRRAVFSVKAVPREMAPCTVSIQRNTPRLDRRAGNPGSIPPHS